MRANIKNKQIAEDKNKIILSVGMIVKNEEKHLENCLSALKRLLDNVPSELIIVDTGSTDRTKEIALKYTDKVYDFEWINDFSAARNYGLEKAKGEWFMSIDADEYLDEDCDEMIKFFSLPELRQKYNSASIYIVNYTNNAKAVIDQFMAPRLVKLTEGVRFHDPIHEYLPQPNPHGIFSTVLHHYGYAYENVEQMHKKAERNLPPLLEEYKKNPKDLRVLAHLADTAAGSKEYEKFEDLEKLYLELYEVAKENLHDSYGVGAYPKLTGFYIRNGKFEKAQKIIDDFFSREDLLITVTTVTMYWYASWMYLDNLDLPDYEKAYENIKKYIEYYRKFKNDELQTVIMRSVPHRGLSKKDYDEHIMNAARCANKLGKYDESLKYLSEFDISKISYAQLKTYLNILRDLIIRTENFSYAAVCYGKILEINDSDKTNLILFLMQQYYLAHPHNRKKFADEMINSGVKGEFIELMKLVRADNDGRDISDDIQKFVDSVESWKDGYAEALYLAMKYGADLTSPIKKMNSKLIRENLENIADAHNDFANVVVEYHDFDSFSQNIKMLYWMVTAFELAVNNSSELLETNKASFFDTFVIALSTYVTNIYNTDLLNDEDADVLPELHRFGYYMTLAFTAQDEGNEIVYIRMLKEALRLCEPMKDVVAYYLGEFEKSLR